MTNFPFVPTIKIVTTSERFELLSKDMDVDAGELAKGEKSLPVMGRELLERSVGVANGTRTVGENARHWQVQIWRTWAKRDLAAIPERMNNQYCPGRKPQTGTADYSALGSTRISVYNNRKQHGLERLRLVLPSSLCASQVAVKITDELNMKSKKEKRKARYVTLPHTEGCGCSSGKNQDYMMASLLLGALWHPCVQSALLIEHGCEKTHNDYFREKFADEQYTGGFVYEKTSEKIQLPIKEHLRNVDEYGWVSLQNDGGIEKATANVKSYFEEQNSVSDELRDSGILLPSDSSSGEFGALLFKKFSELKIGVVTPQEHENTKFHHEAYVAPLLCELAHILCNEGSLVLSKEDGVILKTELAELLDACGGTSSTIPFAGGGRMAPTGVHIMDLPSNGSQVERVSGLGCCVDLLLVFGALPAHPLTPTVTVGHQNADIIINEHAEAGDNLRILVEAIATMAEKDSFPKRQYGQGNVGFQVPRGTHGISL